MRNDLNPIAMLTWNDQTGGYTGFETMLFGFAIAQNNGKMNKNMLL